MINKNLSMYLLITICTSTFKYIYLFWTVDKQYVGNAPCEHVVILKRTDRHAVGSMLRDY